MLGKLEEESMLLGVVYALGACFIWGLIFVVPQFMSGFSSIEIALGRYFFYGMLSLLLFCKSKFRKSYHPPFSIWVKALYFSLISAIIYYTAVVLSVRYSTPAICAIVLGISPITIAFYGNWKQKETTFRSLIIPSLLILVGLVVINVPHLINNAAPSSYFLGLTAGFVALLAWSWYVVANSRFLKHHPEVRSSEWATLMGVATLFWVVVFAAFSALFFKDQLHIEKYFTPSPELTNFLMGNAILGLLCAWVGGFLWNKASLHLPVSLAGQLTIFETIFAVIFFYAIAKHMPPLLESIGVGILLIAILYGIRQFARRKSYNSQLTPH